MVQKYKYIILGLIIISLHAYFRLSHHDVISFDYDQEMIATKAWDVSHDGKMTLIGTRVGEYPFFIGPAYIYLTAIWFRLFNFNPIANFYLSYLWSLATLIALALISKRLSGPKAAFISSSLYAISPLMLRLDRIQWNPNPIPLLSLLVFWILYEIASQPHISKKWFFWCGLIIGFGLNCHFTSILLIIIALIFVHWKSYWSKQRCLSMFLPIVLSISPLIIFDIRHHWLNTRGFLQLFNHQINPSTNIQSSILHRLIHQITITLEFGSRIVWGPMLPFWAAVTIGGIVIILFHLTSKQSVLKNLALLFICIPPLIFMFYAGETPEYYLLILTPIFLLIYSLSIISTSSTFQWIIAFLLIVNIIPINYQWLSQHGDRSLNQKLAALIYIKKQVGHQPIHLTYTMQPQWSFGFEYLSRYIGLSLNTSSPISYSIIYPAPTTISHSQIFGKIGVISNTEQH